MKRVVLYFCLFLFVFSAKAQIPLGKSVETVVYSFYGGENYETFTVGYYKPVNYNSATSDIVFYFHGVGGDENEGYNVLKSIIDRRGSLLVCITHPAGSWVIASVGFWSDEINAFKEIWLMEVLKPLYKSIIEREQVDELPVRLIGFSAGGQCVTRYMLAR